MSDVEVRAPVRVYDEHGNVLAEIGADIFMWDGPPTSLGITGAPYETVIYFWDSDSLEKCHDIGQAHVLREFEAHMRAVIENSRFVSIEWRKRPLLEYVEARDEAATIVDKMTGEHRPGIELRQRVEVRARFVAHMRP